MITLKWEYLSAAVSLKVAGSSGTGFITYDHQHAYLVTACHVLYNKEKNGLYAESIEVHQPVGTVKNNELSILHIELLKVDIAYNIYQDYFIIKLAFLSDKGIKNIKFAEGVESVRSDSNLVVFSVDRSLSLDDVLFGEDVYIIGYPSSVGLKEDPQFDYTKPLVQKGVVSGIYASQKTIILDSSVYPGNSGSIVLMEHDKIIKAVGMILRFIPYEQTWVNLRDKVVNKEYHTSRFSVALSFDVIKENLSKVALQSF
jgi:hypothetical protein